MVNCFLGAVFAFCILFFSNANAFAYELNENIISYSSTYRLERDIKRLNYDIKKNEREIRKIRYSSSISGDEKIIKIRRLKREISNKEREIRRIKAKCQRIIS